MDRIAHPRAPATRDAAWLPEIYRRTADAFSAVAERYDRETETNPLVLRVRVATAHRLRALFARGDHALELGCGTGVEALALARIGVRVTATDVALGMLGVTARRAREAGLGAMVSTRLLAAGRVDALLAEYPRGSFAGAYSSFGPLNCEPDLERMARGLHALIRPGGHLVVSAINRYHPFEFAWYAAHGDLRRATRRWGGHAEGTVSPALPHRVPTAYYTPRALARRLAPWFRPVRSRALLLLLPPPYLAHLLERYPRTFALADGVERRIAGWPVLRALGDHLYLELERV